MLKLRSGTLRRLRLSMVTDIASASQNGLGTWILSAVTLCTLGLAACGGNGDSGGSGTDETASPIKHVIIVVGENLHTASRTVPADRADAAL